MDSYINLFSKGYLKGDKFNSPISLKGAEKLASIFERKYDYFNFYQMNQKNF